MDNLFAHQTMAERLPGILGGVLEANPDYPASIRQAVEQLRADLVNDAPIPMLSPDPAPAADYDDWAAAYQAHQAQHRPLSWQHAPWFFAEMFAYRHLMQAVRWFETGRDPFAPTKRAELANDVVWQQLEHVLQPEPSDLDRTSSLLLASLWGNRADLSHVAGDLAGETASEDDLLVDDRAAVVGSLAASRPEPDQPVHLVIDNVGQELVIDLALADALLGLGHPVVLHAKHYPVFVSDATIPDVWQTLDALEQRGGRPRALALRLRRAWEVERFRLAAPLLWVSSHFLRELPPPFGQVMRRARLVIFKGDVNYRRVIDDSIWGERTAFADVVSHFPAPIVALRSIKSDPLVGVPSARFRALEAQDSGWRTTGRYGLIQAAGLRGG